MIMATFAQYRMIKLNFLTTKDNIDLFLSTLAWILTILMIFLESSDFHICRLNIHSIILLYSKHSWTIFFFWRWTTFFAQPRYCLSLPSLFSSLLLFNIPRRYLANWMVVIEKTIDVDHDCSLKITYLRHQKGGGLLSLIYDFWQFFY